MFLPKDSILENCTHVIIRYLLIETFFLIRGQSAGGAAHEEQEGHRLVPADTPGRGQGGGAHCRSCHRQRVRRSNSL